MLSVYLKYEIPKKTLPFSEGKNISNEICAPVIV